MARLVIGTDKTATTAAMVKGTTPVIDTLNVTPSTSAQTITAPSGTDGYSPVNVSAVTSSIDANIVAGNIKNGVSILGVEGTYTGSAPASYRAFQVDANGKLVNSTSTPWIPLPAGTTDVGDECFAGAYKNTPANVLSGALDLSSLTTLSGLNAFNECFRNCSGITSVNLSSLTTISGNYSLQICFQNCSGITSVNLSSLTTVSSNGLMRAFSACVGITSVNLPSLTTISGTNGLYACFDHCTGITSVNLSSLTTISGISGMNYCFSGCTGITSVNLPSLTTLTGGTSMQSCFYDCTGLISLSFPALKSTSFGTQTNQFNNMLKNVTGCTVHFPSNLQSVIGSWADVTGGFGGTNTTVLFDLPATNTLTGADTITYTRNPKYDTATALAWKVGAYGTTNFTPAYYTSGTTDPAVSGTIYSDAACTTAVTTISSIA